MFRIGSLFGLKRTPEPVPKADQPVKTAPLDNLGIDLPPLPADDGSQLKQAIAAVTHKILQPGGPCPVGGLGATQQFVLARALPTALRAAASPSPHPGMSNPFDAAALLNASPAQQKALERYLHPDFARQSLELKRAILDEVMPLMMPKAQARVRQFHLPRPFSADSGQKPITYAMEAEQGLGRRPQLLDYYAPDPKGRLDPRALPDALINRLTSSGNPQAWLRMSLEQKRSSLTWKMLPPAIKVAYLQEYQKIDPKVTLYRIDDPQQTRSGKTAPNTLADTIKWEGHTPLQCAEIITRNKYESLDLLFSDIQFVRDIAPEQPGFHTHHVFELSTPEDAKRLGPPLVGILALQDLALFCSSTARGGNLLTHTHLEVWQASGINEVASSLGEGKIDPDTIGIHKFHCVGIRAGMYGDPKRIGAEIRAVAMGDDATLNRANKRLVDITADGHLTKLPAPPWAGWNAGDPALPDQAEAAARKDPRLVKFLDGADLDFASILEMAAGKNAKRDAFKFASPFWAYEALPGLADADRARIDQGRLRFSAALLKISATLSEAIEAGRELDAEWVKDAVTQEVRRFHATAKLDEVVDRTLDKLAMGSAP